MKDDEDKNPPDDEDKNPPDDEDKNPPDDEDKNPPDGKEPESAIIKRMREEFDRKTAELTAEYEKKLEDKDAVILDILNGDPQGKQFTIADRINQNRIFKKY